jgi:hypothetical protein
VSGIAQPEKVLPMLDKFARLYAVDRNRLVRSRAKARGLANTILLLHDAKDGALSWILLASPGAGAVHEREQLSNAALRAQRIRIDGYELVRLTRAEKKGGGETWTWRMTEENYQAWRDRIRACIREDKDPRQRDRLLDALYRSPGFRGVRSQVGKLVAFFRAELKRSGEGEADVDLKRTLPYLRRIPDSGTPVSIWVVKRSMNNVGA